MNSPYLRQLFVASSPQLAAISVGGVLALPNVLLEQFKANDSSIHLDMDLATWIGSTHGVAGIPSIAMPTIMQWKGRKFCYLLSCLLLIIGWYMIYFSRNVITIIIAECFQGLGSNSLIVVTFSAISEMLDPKFRLISMSIYLSNDALGVAMGSIIGRYIHWKTFTFIMCIPVTLGFIIGFVWPESPSWLAYKGEYEKCEKTFKWLRGSDESSQNELQELLRAQKEISIANKKTKVTLNSIWVQVTSRDFYMPCFHSFVILCATYGNGSLVVITYGVDMMNKATNNSPAVHYGMIIIYAIIYLGTIISNIMMKFFKNKFLYVTAGMTAATFMFGASVVLYLQSVGVVSEESLLCLYFIICFIASAYIGVTTLGCCLAAEVMPVKHRGLGGAVYVFLLCTLHSIVLKSSPYLILYMGLWGTFMLFSVIEFVFTSYVWRYVPETKGRTLQEIEDFYNHGRFVTKTTEIDDVGESFVRE